MAFRISITHPEGRAAAAGDLQYGPTPKVGDHLFNGIYVTNVVAAHFEPIDGEPVDLVEAIQN
jgi:hypothetical protein